MGIPFPQETIFSESSFLFLDIFFPFWECRLFLSVPFDKKIAIERRIQLCLLAIDLDIHNGLWLYL